MGYSCRTCGCLVGGGTVLVVLGCERTVASAAVIAFKLRHGHREQPSQSFNVAVEHPEHRLQRFLAGDGRTAAEADVVVGDHREDRVAEARFAGEIALGILSHVDEIPALPGEPPAFGAGRKARALDDSRSAGRVGPESGCPAGAEGVGTQPWAVW